MSLRTPRLAGWETGEVAPRERRSLARLVHLGVAVIGVRSSHRLSLMPARHRVATAQGVLGVHGAPDLGSKTRMRLRASHLEAASGREMVCQGRSGVASG